MKKPTSLALVLLVAILAALVFAAMEARDRLVAGRMLQRVESLSATAAQSGRIPSTLTASNLRLLREAEELAPHDVAIPIARGSQYLLMNRPEDALEAYGQALALEARPEIYLNMGRAHLLAGNEEAAIESFASALKLSPRMRDQVPEKQRKKAVERSK